MTNAFLFCVCLRFRLSCAASFPASLCIHPDTSCGRTTASVYRPNQARPRSSTGRAQLFILDGLPDGRGPPAGGPRPASRDLSRDRRWKRDPSCDRRATVAERSTRLRSSPGPSAPRPRPGRASCLVHLQLAQGHTMALQDPTPFAALNQSVSKATEAMYQNSASSELLDGHAQLQPALLDVDEVEAGRRVCCQSIRVDCTDRQPGVGPARWNKALHCGCGRALLVERYRVLNVCMHSAATSLHTLRLAVGFLSMLTP
eukprot:359489-Chlamydomonas_euryale.AAC.3